MSSQKIVSSDSPQIDMEIQKKRWDRIMNILNEPEPEVGLTPKKLVWRKNKASLWHYPAQSQNRYEVPIFLVYSLYNRPYILDLAPGSSLIEGLVKKGYNVYLLDWGIPSLGDSQLSLDDYVLDYLQKGIKRAIRHSGAREITLAGYCLGGTISVICAALSEDLPIRNLAIWTVPIDFSKMAIPEAWLEGLKQGSFNFDRLIDIFGMVPSSYIDMTFRMRNTPMHNYFGYINTLIQRAWDERYVESWKRINKWSNDHVPFAGAAYRQLTNDLYKDNKLVKGEFIIRGENVDLSKIKANLLVVSASRDGIVLEAQALPILDLVSSTDITYEVLQFGHISLVLSKSFSNLLDNWLKDRSLGK